MSTAPHGKKTIKVMAYFWTDDLAPEGEIRPGHAWATG